MEVGFLDFSAIVINIIIIAVFADYFNYSSSLLLIATIIVIIIII
jgi:hypothetical protein